MGNNGYGERNSRGETLINFARSNELKIVNTFFKAKSKRKFTWESKIANNQIVRNGIDFILVRKNELKFVKSFNVLSKFEFESDHKLIRMPFKIKKTFMKKQIQNFIPKITFCNDEKNKKISKNNSEKL
jgi:hypothetical protein